MCNGEGYEEIKAICSFALRRVDTLYNLLEDEESRVVIMDADNERDEWSEFASKFIKPMRAKLSLLKSSFEVIKEIAEG